MKTSDCSDAQLATAIMNGDERSFELLVQRLGGRMFSVARRITGNDSDAQDCVQEAFIKAYVSMDQFRNQSSLGTWLHRIVVNVSLMHLRSQKGGREDSLDDLLPEFDQHGMRVDESPMSQAGEIERLYEQGETRKAVRAAIDHLPREYRAVVIARDIEEMSTAETADVLDISVSLVKTRLHRARAALKTLLDPVANGKTQEHGQYRAQPIEPPASYARRFPAITNSQEDLR